MPETQEEFWTRAIFTVRDVEASVAYYCDKLGFIRKWSHAEGKTIIAAVERGGLQIILDGGTSLPRSAIPAVLSLTLHAEAAIAALHRDLTARGAKVRNAPFAVTWQQGVYQFEVQDLDGNLLVFWGDGLES